MLSQTQQLGGRSWSAVKILPSYFPDTQSCLEKRLLADGQLGTQGARMAKQLSKAGWQGHRHAEQYSLMKAKRKSALKIESKLQVVGTEGSIPCACCQGSVRATPLREPSAHCTANAFVGTPGGQWQQQLDQHCALTSIKKQTKQTRTWLSLWMPATSGDF